ncbi:MAG TPA: hypothetical protein PKO09_06755 [Anaerolineae bacterium]|nr:hypothetical protein [Anaerolineae bacterium]
MTDRSRCLTSALIALLLVAAGNHVAVGQEQAVLPEPAAAGLPDWLEARGLSLAALVGQVPEELLHGTILSYGSDTGIVVYESGVRTGSQVVVTATIYPRVYERSWAPNGQYTQFACLGQKPIFDHLGGAAPEAILRVRTAAGVDVTGEIQYMFVERTGTGQPLRSSLYFNRYPEDAYGPWLPHPLPMQPDGLHIPPNSGCRIQVPGKDYYPLTGVFTIPEIPDAAATVVSTQLAAFQSYIGPGEVGIFAPLMQQLRSRYPDRHGRIALEIPSGATHFLLRFPAMPADPFADQDEGSLRNAARPTGGTYRFSKDGFLSANMTNSAAFPLRASWRDQDQARGSEFLPLMEHPGEMAPPEHIVPSGVAYHSCFTRGDCSTAILEQIHSAVMPMEIVYLSVDHPAAGEWVPVKQAGPAWAPGAGGLDSKAAGIVEPARLLVVDDAVYFPLALFTAEGPPPQHCPSGWFDALGQMLDYYACP